MLEKYNNFLSNKSIPFVKMQGCGNDFVFIDSEELLEKNIQNISKLAEQICDRNFGVGGDGLVIVHNSEKADFRMQIINSDGSEPEMCGNAIRGFAKYLQIIGKTDKKKIEIETLAGIIKPEIVNINNKTLIRVDMGEPILTPEKIPVKGYSSTNIINQDMKIESKTFKITCVSMGNPHCVIFVDSLNDFDFNYWGPRIESYIDVFPKKTNVEFVEVENSENLHVKVWERGAGPTLACGTGACGVLVAANLNKISGKKANIHLPGGILDIEWNNDNRLIMTGPAEVSYIGSYNIL